QPVQLSDELTLDVKNLNAFYGKSHILSDVSFNARKGEVIAVLGRNGAGKSTLLKSLLGLADIGSGEIHLHNEVFTEPKPEMMARKGIAFVPQGRQMFSGLSVKDNFMLGRLK